MHIQKFVYKIIGSRAIKEIALEEIKSIYIALVKGKKLDVDIKMEKDNVILEAPLYIGLEIARRAALIKYAGILISNINSVSLQPFRISFKSISIVPRTIRVEILDPNSDTVAQIRETVTRLKKVLGPFFINLQRPYFDISVLSISGEKHIVLKIPIGRKSTLKRDPFFRPFAPPATMDSVISRVLVNLSKVNIGEILLDPFCGSGSLLIEAYYVGAYPVGLEIHPKSIYGAVYNAQKCGAEINVMVGDATKMPFPDNAIDAIATDPPYGRSAGTFKRTLISLYTEFLKEAYRVLKPHSYLSMCYPPYLQKVPNIASRIGFNESFRSSIYVHRGLTRLISVFFVP